MVKTTRGKNHLVAHIQIFFKINLQQRISNATYKVSINTRYKVSIKTTIKYTILYVGNTINK